MPAPKRERPRLDQLLVDRGLIETRAKAQAMVMAGKVFSGEKKLEKPGIRIDPETALEVRGQPHPWVSRGGLKLAHGLAHFGIDVTGTVAIDVGSSTGGFTDVLLTNGAVRVYAVDVGKGQLAWKLRTDDRVVLMEGVNARNLTAADIPEAVDMVVCDASFIGLELVLPAAMALARPGAHLMALIKPQFEVGKGMVGKGGIVRDQALRDEVVSRIRAWVTENMGWRVLGITESPITGADGNVEYLIAAVNE
ncbi:MAG: 23S rRNA (cytidine1920-2'-O)/16S rRNA (cytidine1409-2'-O)-methyltransferase [Alphaproteobacteria bacterium]|jgi:23S rRNA (cytidine1920-2'-O)/16S rRNA (cytidine1409-2'-O)-methyltransferase